MIKIPKKLFDLVVDLMEAQVEGHPVSEFGHKISFTYEGDVYTGHFNDQAAKQGEKLGLFKLTTDEAGQPALLINDRDSFLTSFAAGALEASRGNGIYYADYASSQFGFTAGYQHFEARSGKSKVEYEYELGYYCHGFECIDTSEIFTQ